MIEVEVLGTEVEVLGAGHGEGWPYPAELERLCALTAARLDVEDGHVAIELVGAQRIAELNREHRGKAGPTDVLSFPIDGVEPRLPPALGAAGSAGGVSRELTARGVPRELGDIVICPEYTSDLREAVVHGMLHLLGMDHETDQGEMLALQDDLLASAGR